jgi:hypothetical protein
MQLRPFAVLGRCWLHEPVELATDLPVESLGLPLSFERVIAFVLELADRLGIRPSADFEAAARDRLEGTEPTALVRFPLISASDVNDGWQQLKPQLDLACDAIAFITGNAVDPIAIVLAADDDTFRARFFPPDDRALIHIDERPARMPQIFAAAQTSGEIGLALSLLRTGAQARTREFRLFYYVEALEVLSGLVPGGGTIAVRIRRLLKHVGMKPQPAGRDPRKDHADVLVDLRNVVGHGKRLDPTTVQPWAADYLGDEHLEVTVRDLVRDVIEELALSKTDGRKGGSPPSALPNAACAPGCSHAAAFSPLRAARSPAGAVARA